MDVEGATNARTQVAGGDWCMRMRLCCAGKTRKGNREGEGMGMGVLARLCSAANQTSAQLPAGLVVCCAVVNDCSIIKKYYSTVVVTHNELARCRWVGGIIFYSLNFLLC